MKKKKPKIQVAQAEEIAQFGGHAPSAASAQPKNRDDHAPQTQADTAPEGESADSTDGLQRQVEELTEKHLRAVAELQNFRRRSATEQADVLRFATADLVRALLPVVDDLERSLATIGPDESSPLIEGVKLVHQNLLKVLTDHHVERIDSVGRPFDPSLHDAMMQTESTEHPPGTVLEEYQPGYKLRDRVLRHAKVIVSKRPENAGSEPDPQAQPADEAAQ